MKTVVYAQRRESGVVAIIVALSIFALMGFAGLVFDLGRLYVNKTELQSAADACALAAANELVCDATTGACSIEFLRNAEAAGIFVASRNQKDFQGSGISIAQGDVRFHTALEPNSSYLPATTGVNTASKFAMCTARSTGIVPWFMGVLGIGANNVSATAVATLAPGQTACVAAPIGICAKPGFNQSSTLPFGYATGSWLASDFNSSSPANGGNGNGGNTDPNNANLAGDFRWVDFTASAGGTDEVREQLFGRSGVCGIKVGGNVKEDGEKQGAKFAWNTRFGFYPNGANAETPLTAPPDKTGYSYPSKNPGPSIPVGTSAYNDYKARQSNHDLFKNNEYAPTGAAGNISGTAINQDDYKRYGAERRLIPVPVIDCDQGTFVPIRGMACVLMLNPMSKGNSGKLYLEWRGLANAANSPCRTSGAAGGTDGALVPTLVQ